MNLENMSGHLVATVCYTLFLVIFVASSCHTLHVHFTCPIVSKKNVHLPGMMVRRVVKAGLADDWSEPTKNEEYNPWMMSKLKESCYQPRQEDDQRKSIVQQVLARSTDLLRRIIAPVKGHGGVILSHFCPHCHRILIENFFWFRLVERNMSEKGNGRSDDGAHGQDRQLESTKRLVDGREGV